MLSRSLRSPLARIPWVGTGPSTAGIAPYALTVPVDLNKHTEQPLQLYIDEFERPFLRDTKMYYEAESTSVISSSTISRFMTKANARLFEEVERSKKICDKSSFDKVLGCRLAPLCRNSPRVNLRYSMKARLSTLRHIKRNCNSNLKT